MGPIKLDELREKSRAELAAQLKELKAELKKLKAERSLPAKVTDGDPNKLSEFEEFRTAMAPIFAELSQQKAALREAYNKKREPLTIRRNYREHPCYAANHHQLSEDGEGKEA